MVLGKLYQQGKSAKDSEIERLIGQSGWLLILNDEIV